MDLVRAEIERKRKAAALASSSTSTPSQIEPDAKRPRVYKTRREIEQEKQRELDAQREAERQERLQQQQATAASNGTSGNTTAVEPQVEEQKHATLPFEEVRRRLRAFDEVVTYFGESDYDREKRYA
jgi:hypothetical protein